MLIQRYFFATKNLWYEHCHLGLSLLANPTYGLFYAPNLIFEFVSFSAAYRVMFVLHFLIFAAGAYHWLRDLGHRTLSVIVVTLMFLASGIWFSTAMKFQHLIYPVAWFPWVCLFARQSLLSVFARNFSAGKVLLTGALIGIAASSGDIAAVLYGALLCVVVGFCEWLSQQSRARHNSPFGKLSLNQKILDFVTICSLVVTGILLTYGPQLVSVLQSFFESERLQGLPLREALAYSSHPRRWIEFFSNIYGLDTSAEFTGKHLTSDIAGRGHWWLTSIFFGPSAAVMFILGILGLFQRKDIRQNGYVLLSAFFLFFAAGQWNPFVVALLETFPKLIFLRYPEKLLVPSTFCALPVLALGFDKIIELIEILPHKWSRVTLLGAFVAVSILTPLVATPTVPLTSAHVSKIPTIIRQYIAETNGSHATQLRAITRFANESVKHARSFDEIQVMRFGTSFWGGHDLFCPDATLNAVAGLQRPEVFYNRPSRERLGVSDMLVMGSLPDEIVHELRQQTLQITAQSADGYIRLIHDPRPIEYFDTTYAGDGCRSHITQTRHLPGKLFQFDVRTNCDMQFWLRQSWSPDWLVKINGDEAKVESSKIEGFHVSVKRADEVQRLSFEFSPTWKLLMLSLAIAFQFGAIAAVGVQARNNGMSHFF